MSDTNTSARYFTFKSPKPLHVGKVYTVRSRGVVILGRLIECDWQGNCRLDTQIEG